MGTIANPEGTRLHTHARVVETINSVNDTLDALRAALLYAIAERYAERNGTSVAFERANMNEGAELARAIEKGGFQQEAA